MAVIVVSRFKGTHDHAGLVREGAALLKRHGAASVRSGRIYAGEYAGQLVVATTYPDMAALGKSQQALQADPEWHKFFAETAKLFELQERSITVAEDF
jgi:NIPSNAP